MKKMYVGGKLIASAAKKEMPVLSPVSEQVIESVAFAGAEDVGIVTRAATEGFRHWKALSLGQRSAWMLKLRQALINEREELLNMLMVETGKQRAVAEDDFDKLQSGLQFFPEAMAELVGEIIPDRDGGAEHKVTYSPCGPVVAYLAWNFPLLNLGYKLGPALAAGCSIIVKPSLLTPLTNYRIGEICHAIDFPAGVINIVAGDNETFGAGLSASKDIAMITMIGSTPSALKVIKCSATSIKRFSLELGGNAPFIVYDDGDIDKALDLLVTLKTANTGQICVSPNRIFLHKDIAAQCISRLVERLKGVVLGDPLTDPEAMGPLISAKERDRVADYVRRSVAAGARNLYGETHAVPSQGYYYPPTVLVDCDDKNPAFMEESFGPVFAITTFQDEEQMIRSANSTRAGLASYLFSENGERLHRVSNALEFGEVMINGCKWDIYLPHIGIKDSGFGADCSHYALHDYLHLKRITTMY